MCLLVYYSLLLHSIYSQNTVQYSPFNIGITGRAFKPNYNFVICSKKMILANSNIVMEKYKLGTMKKYMKHLMFVKAILGWHSNTLAVLDYPIQQG